MSDSEETLKYINDLEKQIYELNKRVQEHEERRHDIMKCLTHTIIALEDYMDYYKNEGRKIRGLRIEDIK